MAKKLFIKFSTQADEKKIFDFYATNQHQFVFQRDPEVWKERISSGAVTLIEDEAGKIVASSISYPIVVKDADGNDVHKWTEIGSTRVSMDGLGLFKTLLSAQVLRAYLFEPPEDRFALEIVLQNAHSKHVFLKNGATAYDIPDDLRDKVMATVTDTGGQKVEWFQIGGEAMPQFAKNLMDAEKAGKILHKDSGEEYELDFSKCILMTVFKEDVKRVSGLDMGDVKKPDLQNGISAFRKKFNP